MTDDLTLEKKWQKPFIERLCDTGNISAACRKAKITRQNAYHARDHDEVFAEAWDEALVVAKENLELEARRRAEGFAEAVYYNGKKVGSVRKYSDTLLIFLLKAHDPAKYRDNLHVEHSGHIGFTADEAAQAEKELGDFTRQRNSTATD